MGDHCEAVRKTKVQKNNFVAHNIQKTTKKSIKKRMSEHRLGFKGKENSGSKKYCFLNNTFSNDLSIQVWTREAKIQSISINNINTTQLSLFSVEEDWIIAKFKPILNLNKL